MDPVHLLGRFFSLSLELLATANTQGFFEQLNPSWEPVLGYTLEELRAHPFIDFVHPDDKARTQHEAAKLFAGEQTIYFENRYRRKNGSYCWLAWSANFSQEDQLVFACARDISVQKALVEEKEAALAELARFQALADSTSDFVGLIDTDHKVIYLNPAGRRLIGFVGDELPRHIDDTQSPEHAQRISTEALPTALEKGSWTGEGFVLHKNGQLIPVSQVVVALRTPSGQHLGFGTIIRDLTAIESYKQTQEELLRQQAMLREMIQAMGTPIIPLTEHIMVMPLIGSMDTQRAEDFLDAALQGAEKGRAQVVIIDITGMKYVDTSVGATLVKAASALRLLGASVVLTGIRAEIARTLVSLGIELPVITRSTLQSGIAYALSISGESLAGATKSAATSRATGSSDF